jgi:hypothetical protein
MTARYKALPAGSEKDALKAQINQLSMRIKVSSSRLRQTGFSAQGISFHAPLYLCSNHYSAVCCRGDDAGGDQAGPRGGRGRKARRRRGAMGHALILHRNGELCVKTAGEVRR